jgi:hypothetical protein
LFVDQLGSTAGLKPSNSIDRSKQDNAIKSRAKLATPGGIRGAPMRVTPIIGLTVIRSRVTVDLESKARACHFVLFGRGLLVANLHVPFSGKPYPLRGDVAA